MIIFVGIIMETLLLSLNAEVRRPIARQRVRARGDCICKNNYSLQ